MWLLEESVRQIMASAPAPTAEQTQQALNIFMQGEPAPVQRTGFNYMPSSADRVMTVSGNRAQIDVMGVLTQSLDVMAIIFGQGNTLYGDLVEAITSAEGDNNIESVDFLFRSPGGQALPTAGVGDLMAKMNKPTRALVDSAHSAAYWLASQCDTIVANTRGASVGSIGVVQAFRKPSENPYVEVTSTDAPAKRPNPETAEGVTMIRDELDVLHNMFAEAVATGRGTTVENVNQNFGRGGSLIAERALEVGMIDAIAAAPSRAVDPSDSEGPHASATIETKPEPEKGAKTMDLATLQREHPALHAEVFDAGKNAGKAEEQNRVKFHATMGKETGAMAYALDACLNGTATDDGEAQAKYMTAGMNKNELDARAQDETHLQDNKPAAGETEAASQKAAVVNLFAQNGVDISGKL